MDSRPDGSSIPDEATLLRRVSIEQFKFCPRTNRVIPTTAVFDDPEMSAHLVEPGESIDAHAELCLRGHAEYFLVRFPVSLIRSFGQKVIRDPEEGDPHHVLVVGGMTYGKRKQLARECEWVKAPPDELVSE